MARGLRLGLPLDQAAVIVINAPLIGCSGANCAPQLLVASVLSCIYRCTFWSCTLKVQCLGTELPAQLTTQRLKVRCF